MDRVNGRVVAIILAVLLAAIATIALSDYVTSQRDQVLADNEAVMVWMAGIDVPAGTLITDDRLAEADQVFVQREVSLSAIALLDAPVGNLADFRGQQTLGPIPKGAILVSAHFGATVEQAAAFQVPEGMVAMSIDVGVTPGVANFIDPGSFVSIVTHLGGAAEGGEAAVATSGPTSRILLQNVEILAIGRRITVGDGGVARSDEALTVTVALTPADAERLVFAQFSSALYLLLEPPGGGSPATTIGRNNENLFTGRG